LSSLWQKYSKGQKIIAMGIMPYRPRGLTFSYEFAKKVNVRKVIEKIKENGCNSLGIVIRDTDGLLTYDSDITIPVPTNVKKYRKILTVDSQNRKILSKAPIIDNETQFEDRAIPNPSGRDLLGEFLDEAKAHDLKFIGSFTLFSDDYVGALRKDWLLRSRMGWSGRVWHAQDKIYNHFICPNYEGYRNYLRNLFQELFQKYPHLDGVGFDYIRFCGPRGVKEFIQSDLFCYCNQCVKLFKEKFSVDPHTIIPHGKH